MALLVNILMTSALVCFTLLNLTGCASSGRIKARNISDPFQVLWAAVLEEVSSYGVKLNDKPNRTIKSDYFQSNFTQKNGVERSQIIVRVSHSRPYAIYVDVEVQLQYDNAGTKYFETYTYDLSLARDILRKILTRLKGKKDSSDFLDDFKPF